MHYSTSIGIDTHAKTNQMCAFVRKTGEIVQTRMSDDPKELIRWIQGNDFPLPLRCCYESGPLGFGLARALNDAGIECVVAATSKLPYRTDRQKNDRADAVWLARMLDSYSVRPVHIPSVQEESLQHLSRLRGEVAGDLRRAKQRVSSFLLLTKTSYKLTKKRWTKTFVRWSTGYEFECEADTFTFRMKMAAVLRLQERLGQVEEEIARQIKQYPYLAERMERFMCIHGIGKVTAFALVCEVYDFNRFRNGAAFASYVGLVPSENSSGQKVSRGKITKTGNAHLRRLLIEVASCYSRPAKDVKPEDASVSEPIRAKAEKCKHRLLKRRKALGKRNLKPNKVKTAIARELCEWIYHIAVMPD
jgi:transposase